MVPTTETGGKTRLVAVGDPSKRSPDGGDDISTGHGRMDCMVLNHRKEEGNQKVYDDEDDHAAQERETGSETFLFHNKRFNLKTLLSL